MMSAHEMLQALQQKDKELQQKDKELQQKDKELQQKDKELQEQKQTLQQQQEELVTLRCLIVMTERSAMKSWRCRAQCLSVS